MKKVIRAAEDTVVENDLNAKLSEIVENAIHDMEDEYLNVNVIKEKIPEYDADWCIETPTPNYDKALKQFVKAYVDEYMYYKD